MIQMIKHEREQLSLRLEAEMSILLNVGRVMDKRMKRTLLLGATFGLIFLKKMCEKNNQQHEQTHQLLATSHQVRLCRTCIQ